MRMKLHEYTARFPDRGLPVPAEYAGQWVAWNLDRTEILANGEDLEEVRRQAVELGCERPLLQKIPRGLCVGGA